MESINDNIRYSGTYLLAGTAVHVTTLYNRLHSMCADYLTKEKPQLFIETTEEEIAEERLNDREESTDPSTCSGQVVYSSSYIETLLVYRKLALQLLDHGILLIHGSCIAVDGQGVLFTALSGTGKSTHTRLWRELLGDRVVMVNNDKPLVKVRQGEPPIIYGTPWDGKHHLSTNTAVPLKAIVYLQRGEQNEIHQVRPAELVHILIQQIFHTDNPDVTLKVLDLIALMAREISFFDLHCNMTVDAAELVYRCLYT